MYIAYTYIHWLICHVPIAKPSYLVAIDSSLDAGSSGKTAIGTGNLKKREQLDSLRRSVTVVKSAVLKLTHAEREINQNPTFWPTELTL